LLEVISFIFHNLEKLPVCRTGAFHYKRSNACTVVLTQTTSFLNHLKPLLCYVMPNLKGALSSLPISSSRSHTSFPGFFKMSLDSPAEDQTLQAVIRGHPFMTSTRMGYAQAVASIWFEIWGVVDPDKKNSIFSGRFEKNFDFFWQFHNKIDFYRQISEKFRLFQAI